MSRLPPQASYGIPPAVLERAIHLRLELPEQLDRRCVVERQELREKDAAHALRAVDPEVRVREPGPRQAPGRAARGRLTRVDEEAQAPLFGHPGEQLEIVGERRDRRLELADLERADVVLPHEVHRLAPQELAARRRTAPHDRLRESQVVAGGAVEPAAAHEELRLLGQPELDRRERAVGAPLMHAGKPRALRWGELEGGILHPERAEDVLLEV